VILIDSSRETMYEIVKEYFDAMSIKPILCELGVLYGENAANLIRTLEPRKCYLVDSYTKKSQDAYKVLSRLHNYMSPLDSYSDYYGGSLSKQKTFDKMYQDAKKKITYSEAVFLKLETTEAVREIKEELDFIYVDANHNYENVLEDLFLYSKKLTTRGVIQLNDVVMHHNAHRQNIGVIDALNRFIKISGFEVVCMNLRDWTDAIITTPNNANIIKELIYSQKFLKLEIPNSLMAAYKIIESKNGCQTFSFD
jgi:hypothetical protein